MPGTVVIQSSGVSLSTKRPRYGLSRRHTRKHARDYVDQDYIEKLSEKEKDWLDKFNREYYQNKFSNTAADLHDTKEEKRVCYGAENARFRDMFTKFYRVPGDTTTISNDEEDK